MIHHYSGYSVHLSAAFLVFTAVFNINTPHVIAGPTPAASSKANVEQALGTQLNDDYRQYLNTKEIERMSYAEVWHARLERNRQVGRGFLIAAAVLTVSTVTGVSAFAIHAANDRIPADECFHSSECDGGMEDLGERLGGLAVGYVGTNLTLATLITGVIITSRTGRRMRRLESLMGPTAIAGPELSLSLGAGYLGFQGRF